MIKPIRFARDVDGMHGFLRRNDIFMTLSHVMGGRPLLVCQTTFSFLLDSGWVTCLPSLTFGCHCMSRSRQWKLELPPSAQRNTLHWVPPSLPSSPTCVQSPSREPGAIGCQSCKVEGVWVTGGPYGWPHPGNPHKTII